VEGRIRRKKAEIEEALHQPPSDDEEGEGEEESTEEGLHPQDEGGEMEGAGQVGDVPTVTLGNLTPADEDLLNQMTATYHNVNSTVYYAFGVRMGFLSQAPSAVASPALPDRNEIRLHNRLVDIPPIVAQPDDPSMAVESLNFSQYFVRFQDAITNPDEWNAPPIPSLIGSGSDVEALTFFKPIADRVLLPPNHYTTRSQAIKTIHKNACAIIFGHILYKFVAHNFESSPPHDWRCLDAYLHRSQHDCVNFLRHLGYHSGLACFDDKFWKFCPGRKLSDSYNMCRFALGKKPPIRPYHNGESGGYGVWYLYCVLYRYLSPRTTYYVGLEEKFLQADNKFNDDQRRAAESTAAVRSPQNRH
jgi:hypothetical protein